VSISPGNIAARHDDQNFTAPALIVVALIWAAFVLLHPLLRLSFDIGLGPADSLELIAGQDVKYNYRARQPPLYTWLIALAYDWIRPIDVGVKVVKYGLMAIAGLGFYMAGLAATGDRLKAALGTLMALMLFNVGFTIHDQSTHSVALIASVGLLAWGYMAIARSVHVDGVTSLRACLIAVLAGAIAVLSKHSAWLLLIAFPLALLAVRDLRQNVSIVRLAAVMLVTLTLAAPLIYFLIAHIGETAHHVEATLGHGRDMNPIWSLLRAQLLLAGGLVALVGPVMLIAAMTIWRRNAAAKEEQDASRATPSGESRGRPPVTRELASFYGNATPMTRVMVLTGMITLAIYAAILVVSGASKVPSRHLIIAAIPLALSIAWASPRERVTPQAVARFLMIVILAQGALLLSRAAGYAFPGQPFCSDCHQAVPVDRLAGWLRQTGYATGTIITEDRITAGNVLRFLPDVRVVYTRLPTTARPAQNRPNRPSRHAGLRPATAKNACTFVSRRNPSNVRVHATYDRYDLPSLLRQSPVEAVTFDWPTPVNSDVRRSTWYIVALPATARICQ